MRIIGGTFGGRRFNPPARIPARPTTDLAKGALFNTLSNMMELEGIRCLDLFAGTGSISYELASRGASEIWLVERDRTSLDFIRKTARALGIEQSLHVAGGDVFKFLKQCTGHFDLIFADPPYELERLAELPDTIFERQLLAPEGVLIVEHSPRHNFEQHPNFLRSKQYGDTLLTFFSQSK
jgi:16S rRNA (guanine966-N2)-methyltransferase